MKEQYYFWLNMARSIDELGGIAEAAANDDTLTNSEYCDIYAAVLAKYHAIARY